jgi:PAS domain S-box
MPMMGNRAAVLRLYGLDAPSSELRFDSFARLAATIADTPVCLVGFTLDDREVIGGSFGWSIPALPIESSFAQLLTDSMGGCFVSPLTTADARVATHPMVASPPSIRFLAGVPLCARDGTFLGALTVLDRVERTLTPRQVNSLLLVGEAIVHEIETRNARRASEAEPARLREMLEDSEARFRDFFEQTDDFVLSIDVHGRLLHSNEALLLALGETRDEIRSGPLLRLLDPQCRESFRAALQQVFDTGEPVSVETTFITRSGRSITVDGVLQPRLVDGKAMLARVIFRDITDRKAFEADLANARDAALEAARLKTQFLTNVSHEIRTPMNAIVGMIDLLSASVLTPEQVEHVYDARASADQLLSLVNNVLSISTIEAGRLTVSNLDFDLMSTLRRVVEVMRVAALGKDLTVSLEYDDKLPTIVRGSRTRVSQIVTNLLENAVKFTESGAVVLRVFLQSETESHRVIRFEVTDTGIGIAAEDRLLIFERFSQVDATSTRKFGGVGLGLAAARHLVETIGGLMDFESTPGTGSTFWFSIPFPRQLVTEAPAGSSQLEFKGRRVLLVDHLPTSRKIVMHYLEQSWEMRVATASDAAGILAILKNATLASEPIQAVIFDALPDATLEGLAGMVRDDTAIAGTPLIYLLGTEGRGNDAQLRTAGITAALAKPVGQSELHDALTMAFAPTAVRIPQALAATRTGQKHITDIPFEVRSGLRVLLAEDNFLNRKLTLTQLQKLGLRTTAVVNGKEALEAAGRERYDVILMDCQMPIVDGYEATLELRRREKTTKHRHHIIAMTANAREGDREKCLAAGMDDYLPKPTRQEDLSAAVANYFDTRK